VRIAMNYCLGRYNPVNEFGIPRGKFSLSVHTLVGIVPQPGEAVIHLLSVLNVRD